MSVLVQVTKLHLYRMLMSNFQVRVIVMCLVKNGCSGRCTDYRRRNAPFTATCKHNVISQQSLRYKAAHDGDYKENAVWNAENGHVFYNGRGRTLSVMRGVMHPFPSGPVLKASSGKPCVKAIEYRRPTSDQAFQGCTNRGTHAARDKGPGGL